MNSSHFRIVATVCACGFAASLVGAEPKIESAKAPPILFDGPMVTKLSWSTSGLLSTDLNKDGRNDLALINSNQARIELLYQLAPGETPKVTARPVSSNRWEPVLDDAPFQKASVVTGQSMNSLAAGDFDNDGRIDLAYTNDQGRLVVRYQDADEAWTRRTEFEIGSTLPYDGTMKAVDVDKDGRTDLIVLVDKAIHIFDQHEKAGVLRRRVRLPIEESEAYNLEFADLDGDGRDDIYYLGISSPESLLVRRQDAEGNFVVEEAYDLEGATRSEAIPFRRNNEAGKPVQVLRIHDGTGLVELRSLTSRDDPSQLGLALPFQRYAAPVQSLKTSSFAVGNFGGRGGHDVVLGDGEGAQVWLLQHEGAGRYAAPVSFPAFGGLSDIATLESGSAGGLDSLVVISQREKALGIMRRENTGKPFAYPEPLPVAGTPLAVATIRHADGARVVCIAENDKKRQLQVFEPSGANYIAKPPMPLPTVLSKPRALRPFDFNQDGIQDLLVFSPDETLRVYLQNPDGNFAEFTDAQGLSGSLVDKLDASSVTGADIDGDGKDELVIARKRFARALRINAKSRVEVVAQFSAEDELADLGFAFLLTGEKGQAALIAYDANRGRMLRAERDDLGVFRQNTSTDVRLPKNANVVSAALKDGFLAFVGGNTLQLARPGKSQRLFAMDASYETDLDDVTFQNVFAGQMVGSEMQAMALDSSKSRVLEILEPPTAERKAWLSLMHFRVFEQDPHYRGKTGSNEEPHGLIVADITGDKKNDIVMLVHDRLLLYPGRK